MEPEGSLPRSQEIAAGPYPQPDESSPYHLLLFVKDSFKYYLSTYAYVFFMVFILLASPLKLCMHFSSPPYHALLILNILFKTLTVHALHLMPQK
jgi:hypothetical protein